MLSSDAADDKLPKIAKPRPMFYFAHHALELSDEVVLDLLRTCNPGESLATGPYSERDFEQALADNRKWDFYNPLGHWYFPFQMLKEGGATASWSRVEFVLNLHEFLVKIGEVIQIPAMLRDPFHWLRVNTMTGYPESTTQYGSDWFFEHAMKTTKPFPPEFAFADTIDNVVRNLDRVEVEPREFAWPFMILGPAEVARFGEERVASAPAWKVAKREDGGYLIQAAPNPFMTPQEELTALAKHLGLKARR